jgi:predicted ATPase
MNNTVFLNKIKIHNYKSIADCTVDLKPLNYLVGPNGAGKSNFLDALRFVAESLNTSLDHAFRERGGINEVRRRSSGHPTHFGIRLEFRLSNNSEGYYAFRIGSKIKSGFEVQKEECQIYGPGITDKEWFIVSDAGKKVAGSQRVLPAASSDRLYLVAASGLPRFRPLFDALSQMGFYNFNPEEIRELQPPDTGELLRRDGSNLASVLGLLAKENKEARQRVIEYLSKVVPGMLDVAVKHIGKKDTLEFRQAVGKNASPWRFLAENMSDGTLRALGVLTALFQSANGGSRKVLLVGIEEPEVAVHPGAAGVLRDSLKIASAAMQVLVTSHSPDLLDDKSISETSILAVENVNGATKIGRIDEAGRSAIRDRLYTAGELLRQNDLKPDISAIEKTPQQQELFAEYQR